VKLSHDEWAEILLQEQRDAAFERNDAKLHRLAVQLGADGVIPLRGGCEWMAFVSPPVYSPAIRGFTRGKEIEFRMAICSEKDRDSPLYGAPTDVYFHIPWPIPAYLTRSGKRVHMDTWCIPHKGKAPLLDRALLVREALFAPRIFEKTCRRRIIRDEAAQERAFQWVDLLQAHAVHRKEYPWA
jgi:hypothetical protein